MLCCADHASHRQQGNFLSFKQNFAFSVFNRTVKFLQPPVSLSSGVTDGYGSLVFIQRVIQFPAKLPQILWGHDRHIGNTGQIGQIKNTLMGFSVAAHQSCPIQGKYYGKILNAHIMENLIKASLQKRRVHGNHWLHACRRHACRRSHCMLLCNSHIKETVRKLLFKWL